MARNFRAQNGRSTAALPDGPPIAPESFHLSGQFVPRGETTLKCGANCQAVTDPKPIGKHTAECPGFTPDMYQHDVLTAREYIDEVALIGDRYLAETQRPTLWQMATIVYAKTGQLVQAKAAFARLNALRPVTANDPLNAVMQTTEASLRDGKVLSQMGRVSAIGGLPSWHSGLARHNISVVNVAGKLDRITIDCGEHLIESPFSDKAEWHIPPSWNKCRLSVYGTPGTTFTLGKTDE